MALLNAFDGIGLSLSHPFALFTPSRTQAALLERCFGDRRFAYNQQVEAFNTYDKETNPKPEYPNVTTGGASSAGER